MAWVLFDGGWLGLDLARILILALFLVRSLAQTWIHRMFPCARLEWEADDTPRTGNRSRQVLQAQVPEARRSGC